MGNITIKNIDRLTKRLNNVSTIDMVPMVNKATLIVEAQAKALCDGFQFPTGALKGSIHPKVEIKGKNVIGSVYTSLNHAPYIEFGTGIKGNGTYPYSVKGLSLEYRSTPWVYNDGDQFWYTKGQVAKPFMYPALNMNKERIRNLFQSEYKKAIHQSIKGG